MGSAMLTLAAAVIGGAVSLVSVLLAQRHAQRVHQREQERLERHRQEDLKRARADRLLAERQAAYVRFNAAARTVRDTLAACALDLRRAGRLDSSRRDALQEGWRAYVAQHAEANIIASDEVHGRVNGALQKIHRHAVRLDTGLPEPGDGLDDLGEQIEELWERLVALREGMRHDLGMTSE
ncbi:hypothetical protein ACWCPT_01430 [Streptomyces sp. NPDC002308]